VNISKNKSLALLRNFAEPSLIVLFIIGLNLYSDRTTSELKVSNSGFESLNSRIKQFYNVDGSQGFIGSSLKFDELSNKDIAKLEHIRKVATNYCMDYIIFKQPADQAESQNTNPS
jgi:hypothetical protein